LPRNFGTFASSIDPIADLSRPRVHPITLANLNILIFTVRLC